MGLPVKEGLVRLVNFKPMARNVSPAAIPREISSRSLKLSTLGARLRCAGAIPLRLAGRGTGSWFAGLARWRCRGPSRQLYIGARVLRVLSLEPLHPPQLRSETLTPPYFACQLK